MQLSPHFTTAEFERSQVAARHGITIHIQPASTVWENAGALCAQVLEPLRAQLARPIIISSGYRTPELNALVGGALGSQHTRGEAADIVVAGMSDYDLAKQLYASGLPYDQLIYEFGRWVHVSHARHGKPRGDVLTATRREAAVHYSAGITPLGSARA